MIEAVKRYIPKMLYVLSMIPFAFMIVQIIELIANFSFAKDGFVLRFIISLTSFGIIVGMARITELLSTKK